MRVLSAMILLCCLSAFAVPSEHAAGSATRRSDRASELEQRLFAPCCWMQTLDVHESEISTALRSEIQQRLAQGESALSIEDALASRYGERIRAVPRESGVRDAAPVIVGALMVLSLLALLWVVRRRALAPALEEPLDLRLQHYDAELERELARVELRPRARERRMNANVGSLASGRPSAGDPTRGA